MTERTTFSGASSAVESLVEVINTASRGVTIFSPELDHSVFDDPALVEALSSFSRSSAIAKVGILISDSRSMVSRGHQLVELARRLPSHFTIRKQAGENKEHLSFVTADLRAFWFLPDSQILEGYYNLDDPVRVERLNEQFIELDRRSAPDPELRILQL